MKKIYRVLILAVCLVIFGSFAVVQYQKQKPRRYQGQFFDCFDTVTVITGYAKSEEDFSEKVKLLQAKLTHYHQLFDIYHTYEGINNLKSINDAAGKEAVKVDAEIIKLLKLGRDMHEKTEGKLQIVYGSVLSLWHEYRERGVQNPKRAELPPKEELNRRAGHTDIGKLILDEEASTVYLAEAEMSLDVGSIGKGYAVQRLAEYAREIGMEHVLISVGGNVCAIGAKEDGTPWLVGVENPDLESSQPYIGSVELSDQSIVTSGDYQRYYEVDHVRYCHIIDPNTNMPPAYFSSVSVISSDSGLADALSTSLFCMEYEAGLALVESLADVEAMWIGKDGKIRCSSGFEYHEEK
ncbi:FAD:protein FMN transferase [Lachnospiraceae bacterium 45-W7]